MPALSIYITGTVQGVCFRAYAKEKAEELGITGWVRNNSDGSVEIHAEGDDVQLRQLKEWCRQGPPAAEVEKVMMNDTLKEGGKDFAIRY